LHLKLRAGIDGACRLVQNQQRRVLDHGAGDGDELLLPRREAVAVAQHRVIAFGQLTHKIGQPRRRADLVQLLVRDAFFVVDEVFPQRPFKQPGVLQYHSELRVDIFPADIRDVHAVDGDSAAVQLVKTHQQIDHGRFPRAGGADDGDLLSRFDLVGEVMDDRSLRVVAEGDMVEGNIAAHVSDVLRFAAFIRHLRFLQKLEHALAGRRHALHAAGRLGEILQRLGKEADVQHERHDGAEGNRTLHGQHRAHNADRHIGEVAHENHERHHEAGQELAFPGAEIQPVVLFVKRSLLFFFAVVRLDHIVPADGFLHMAVDGSELCLLTRVIGLRVGNDQHHDRKPQQRRENPGQRQEPVCQQHHHRGAQQQGKRRDKSGKALIHRLSHGVHVVRHAAEHVAGGGGIKVFERQPVDLFGNIPPHVLGDALGDRRHNETLNAVETIAQRIEKGQQHRNADDLRQVDGGRESRGDQVCHLAELVRAYEVQDCSRDGEDRREIETPFEFPKIPEEIAVCLFQIFAFFSRAHGADTGPVVIGGHLYLFSHFAVPPLKAASP